MALALNDSSTIFNISYCNTAYYLFKNILVHSVILACIVLYHPRKYNIALALNSSYSIFDILHYNTAYYLFRNILIHSAISACKVLLTDSYSELSSVLVNCFQLRTYICTLNIVVIIVQLLIQIVRLVLVIIILFVSIDRYKIQLQLL